MHIFVILNVTKYDVFAYDVFGFGYAYLTAAIGGSLKSGITESILYETLLNLNRENEYVKWKGRLKFVKYMVTGCFSIAGGYVASLYSFEMTYWLSIIGIPFAILLASEPI